MTRTKYILKRIVGSWRFFWGFCPKCDSSAPEVDDCRVCHGCRVRDNEMLRLWKGRYDAELERSRALYLTNKQLDELNS